MNLFEGYVVYGPTWNKSIGRYMIFLVSPLHRTSMTYARYLMILHVGRLLKHWEEVDHVDGDKTNDAVNNLQILDKRSNIKKSKKPVSMVTLRCPVCDKQFSRERRQTHLFKKTRHTCCSRKCSGIYSHAGL